MTDVPIYKGLYAVTEEGHVWSHPRQYRTGFGFRKTGGKFLKQRIDTAGYYSVGLWKHGKQRAWRVHHLMALTFLEKPKTRKRPEVNHIDGVKLHNHRSNLEWISSQANKQHAVRLGLRKLGENAHNAILTNDQVIELRSSYPALTYKQLAAKYGIKYGTARDIIVGRRRIAL